MAVGKTEALKLLPIKGVNIGTSCAGIKQQERDDITLFQIAKGSNVAGMFTKNKFCAAPVHIAKQHLQEASSEYLLINSGNANAGTGEQGMLNANKSCSELANLLNVKANQVLPFSTGVIGETLPIDKLVASLPLAIANLSEDNWQQASKAIMTTDTRQKGCSHTFEVDGETISITGIAKGSGMIRPDMATMLSYIATDMPIQQALLQEALKQAVGLSFNSITVDGDTSTNDAVILMATGRCEIAMLEDKNDARYQVFLSQLIKVCQFLAEAIVRDGEGATKLITIQVNQADSIEDAREVAFTVAHSPLVKTAFFAADPNWGRILAAVGRANISELNIAAISIYLEDVCIVRDGEKAAEYTEEKGQQVMAKEEITVLINLAKGSAEAKVLSCDLSYDYVKINAEYRT